MSQSFIEQKNVHHSLGMTDADVIKIYRTMRLARLFDERSELLQRAGKVAFHVSGQGQEAAQAAAAHALDLAHDMFFPYYRDYAFVLGVGCEVSDLMLSLFAKAADPFSGGRQMPGHFGYKAKRIVTGSSPVTTQVPHAAGFALVAKMRNQPSVSFVTFGEGSSNQGDFHEGLNFAGVHKLPVIFFCENNQYAISVPYVKQMACAKVSDRAAGYGFPGVSVDGTDPFEVYAAVKTARERALRGEGPTLIEAQMYRLMPHSTSDDDSQYRSKAEVQAERERDPLPRMLMYMMQTGIWDDVKEAELKAECVKIINAATELADKAPYPVAEDTLKHVYEGD